MTASDGAVAFDVRAFEALRSSRGVLRLGKPLQRFESVESTNDEAKTAARAGAPAGALFLAEYQTRGRGRRDQPWLSTARANLLFSLVLRPEFSPGALGALPLVVGLAVVEAVSEGTSLSPMVKWPNDVLLGGRKVAGVLIESQLQGEALCALVVGVGVNVNETDFDEDVAATATSLKLEQGRSVSREHLLAVLLQKLETLLDRYSRYGLEPLLASLRRVDALLDQWIEVDGIRGVAVGLDEDGALLVDSNGTRKRIVAGSVTMLAASAGRRA